MFEGIDAVGRLDVGAGKLQARVGIATGLWLVAALIPLQIAFGHLNGDDAHQPAKFAAIEARCWTEQPASEVLIGVPDEL